MLLFARHHLALLLPSWKFHDSRPIDKEINRQAKKTLVDMQNWFGDALHRVSALSASLCSTTGCREIFCPDLLQRMDCGFGVHAKPFLHVRIPDHERYFQTCPHSFAGSVRLWSKAEQIPRSIVRYPVKDHNFWSFLASGRDRTL